MPGIFYIETKSKDGLAQIDIAASEITLPIKITASDVTLPIKITTSDITMPVDIAAMSAGPISVAIDVGSIVGNLPVDIKAQAVGNLTVDIAAASVGIIPIDVVAQTLGAISIDIVAQTVGNLSIDIAAQTVGALAVNLVASAVTMNVNANITAQTIENISVDLAAQSVGAISVVLVSSTALLDFNIAAQAVTLNIRLTGQAKGVLSLTDWATQDAIDLHLQGAATGLAATATATLITLILTTTDEHWLYTVHISGTKNGLGKVRANKTAGYDELAGGYFSANDGYIKDWLAPIKRRKDVGAGITVITVEVTNNDAAAAGNFMATLDGIRTIDITAGEKIYTSQAEWQACATQTDIDLVTLPGDVIPATI